jgi:hypothetical protein
MSTQGYSYFVIAAIISAELENATKVAKQLSLTASNARAVALRAGEGAAGFRPLTDFIDNLASVTMSSSRTINILASKLSRTASDYERACMALIRFDHVFTQAKNARYIESLRPALETTTDKRNSLHLLFNRQISQLNDELDGLAKELRTAVILATLSRVEASQVGEQFEVSLNSVAENVADAAAVIRQNIQRSQKLVTSIN